MPMCEMCNERDVILLDGSETITTNDTTIGPFCEECWSKVVLCQDCNIVGTVNSDIKITEDGKLLCSSCLSAYHPCKLCDTLVGGRKVYCDTCKRNLVTCGECGKRHLKQTSANHIDSLWPMKHPDYSSKPICETCMRSIEATVEPKYAYSCKYCSSTSSDVNTFEGEKVEYCNRCYSELFRCDNCGDLHVGSKYDRVIHDADNVELKVEICYDCWHSKFATCGSCGYIKHRKDCKVFNYQYICNHCIDTKGIVKCGQCSTHTTADNTTLYRDYLTLCEGCTASVSTCKDCGTATLKSWSGRCRACAAVKKHCGRIYSYSHKPGIYKNGTGKLYFGIENEVHCSNDRYEDMVDKIYAEHSEEVVHVKSDSSIDNGFEIVLQPFTFDALKKLNKEALFQGCFHRHESCGMHVHVNRDAFTKLHMYKFIKFINDEDDLVIKIAERNDNGYSSKFDGKVSERVLKNYSQRYSRVNLKNKDTIEVRIFANAEKETQMMKNVEFLDSLYYFTLNISNKEVNTQEYMKFLSKSKKKYPNLCNFLSI